MYEGEYLDTLEILAYQIRCSERLNKKSSAQEPGNQIDRSISTDRKLMIAALQQLSKGIGGFSSKLNHMVVDEIREEAKNNMFTAAGKQRALRIADSIVSSESVTPRQMNFEQQMVFGEKQYFNYCVACHQRNGEGITGAFPSLIGAPSLRSAKTVIDIVVRGSKAMPSWRNTLSSTEIAAVVTYIRARFGNEKTSPIKEDEVLQALNTASAVR